MPGSRWTLPGFEVIERPGARVLARSEAVSWVRFVLEQGRGLHSAASVDRASLSLEGRQTVFIIPARSAVAEAEETGTRWAVRHYTRGGRIVPLLLDDRYLLSRRIRPFHEAEASEAARMRGIPTPRVLAAAMYPAGIFYRADLVTEFVSGASDLVEVLFDTRRKGAGGAGERLDALRAAGELVRRMAAAGLRHRDMHARNVLLEWKGAAPIAHLLDLDRCDVGPEGRPSSPHPMYRRLRGSLRKWEVRTGIRVSEREWSTLGQAVGG